MAMIPFISPSAIIVTSPSQGGKTTFISALLQEHQALFDQRTTKIIYCYNTYSSKFDELQSKLGDTIVFKQGLPELDDIHKLSNNAEHKILVIDDLAESACQSYAISQLFTVFVHHYNISVLFLTQNMHMKGKYTRTINLNAQVVVILASQKDNTCLLNIGRGKFPKNMYGSYFFDTFKSISAERYGYLVIDMHPKSNSLYQLRTKIFPADEELYSGPIVYLPQQPLNI
jgi:hypothetical protein